MDLFYRILEYTALLVEVIASLIMFYTVFRSLYELVWVDHWNLGTFHRKPLLTDGIISALELLMVAEVLKTIMDLETKEIINLSLLVLIRVFLSYVLRQNAQRQKKVTKEEA